MGIDKKFKKQHGAYLKPLLNPRSTVLKASMNATAIVPAEATWDGFASYEVTSTQKFIEFLTY
jgi:hypothetical protein